MDSNLSGAFGGTIWGRFQGSLTHLRSPEGSEAISDFVYRNGLYMCPTHSSTYFMFNSRLLGAFRPSKLNWNRLLQLGGIYHFLGGDYHFWGAISLLAVRIYWGLDCHFIGGFLIGGKIINSWGHIINFWGRDY